MVSGWWRDYSYRCQPVDYSNNPKAIRVSNIYSTGKLQYGTFTNFFCYHFY